MVESSHQGFQFFVGNLFRIQQCLDGIRPCNKLVAGQGNDQLTCVDDPSQYDLAFRGRSFGQELLQREDVIARQALIR
jgi:hypothetical protein